MKTIGRFAFLVLIVLFLTQSVAAQVYPAPIGYVNDFAHLLSDQQVKTLNDELAAFDKRTTYEIAVVTVSSLGDYSIENYTRGLATTWKVGKKGKDNGVVFLVAPNEHKVRIELADGVLPVLSSYGADKIRDQAILPAFRASNYPQGIIDGVHAIMNALDPLVPKTESRAASPFEFHLSPENLLFIVSATIALCVIIAFSVAGYMVYIRNQAKKYVIGNVSLLANMIHRAEMISRSEAVDNKMRTQLANLRVRVGLIIKQSDKNHRGDWLKKKETLDKVKDRISDLIFEMQSRIAYVEKAKTEGPVLLQKFPQLIQKTAEKLKEGEKSESAVKSLNKAHETYKQAQLAYQNHTYDWVMLYGILQTAHRCLENAESEHYSHNHPSNYHSSSYSSSDSSSFSSFGGGGGYSGGGSTGTW